MMQMISGLALICIGVLNMKGNISMLHSYHKKRIKAEDIRPFGRIIGIGSIIIGIAIMVAGVLTLFKYVTICNVVLIVGFVIGGGIILYALLKYNKGIF